MSALGNPAEAEPAAPAPDFGPQRPDLGDPVLDNPAWASLTGAHRQLAVRHGRAARYQDGVARFAAVSDVADPRSWADLAALVGPSTTVLLAGEGLAPTAGWRVDLSLDGVQLVDVSLTKAGDPEAVLLGPDDVPEMLELVRRTEPGPFEARTIELGSYLGIRRNDALVAMAGERLHPPGWTEISAVCTDPGYRGQGLGTRLVRAVAAGIADRGEQVLLHAAATNVDAIRLYLALGFALRRRTRFSLLTSPA